jgi:ABC-type nitrate/sulfonate/bicarbonate transport system substrate-binding protein
MTRTIRLQGDSNAHDRPWRIALEQGFFAAEDLDVEYYEDNPKGTAGRVEDFSQRWKESQLREGALEVYPVCEWGAIERVQALGGGKIIGLDTTVRTGALMVRKESTIQSLRELRNVPIAVTWHAGTFYAAIEALEAAGVPFPEIKLVHANDRLGVLLSGEVEAAALMEPLVSRAAAAGAREFADLRWAAALSPATTSMKRPWPSCGARSIAPSTGCAKMRTARARRCCATSSPANPPAA